MAIMKFPWRTHQKLPLWNPILGEEGKSSEETLLPDNPSSRCDLEEHPKAPKKTQHLCLLTALNTLILCSTITLLSMHIFSTNSPAQNAAMKELSYYSPIYDDIPIPIHTTRINGTLFPGAPENQAWSRLEPGHALGEATWESFEKWRPIALTREQVLQLGKDPETVARFAEGGYTAAGEDAYIASPDIYHKIHCLNELRKNAFLHYPSASSSPSSNNPTVPHHGKLWWIHLRHCTDILLQDLLCNANADLITYQWIETQQNPFPDFSINRKCRDLGAVERWQGGHSAGVRWDVSLKKPSNLETGREVEMEEGYWDIFPDERGEMSEHHH